MAEIIQDENVIQVLAKDTRGLSAILFQAHMPSQDRRFPVQKSTDRIVDVAGSRDGAQSVVHASWNGRNKKAYRLKETPEELMDIFEKAGNPLPIVEKSIGRRWRDIQFSVRVPNLV